MARGQAHFSRGVVFAAAAASSALFTHWLVTQPELADLRQTRPAFFTMLLASHGAADPVTEFYQASTLVLAAVTGLIANALALSVELRTSPTPATRRLALSLSLAALAAAWFFFAALHGEYRHAFGYGPSAAWNMVLNAAGYLAGALSPYFMMRFFLGYPRPATPEEWQSHYRRLHQEQVASTRRGWRARLIPGASRRQYPPQFDGHRWQLHKFVASWRGAAFLAGFGVLAAAIDAFQAAQPGTTLVIPQAVTFGALYMGILLAMVLALQAMKYHVRNSVAEDRRRIDWLYGTLLVGGILLLVVSPAWWAMLPLLLPRLEAAGLHVAGPVLLLGPFSLALQLAMLAFVVALALSIFHRGTVDPRLAVGKVTVFGAVGIVLAFLFVLLERMVAYQVAAWLGLGPESGALIAGALVAASVSPVRTRADRWVGRFLARYLPLESIMQGERKVQSIVLSDLSGYTALSARDEKQAMLVAALLQRQALLQCEAHSGRIVKTMGDAVLLAFDDAPNAARALAALHRDFPPAATALGVEPLPVHSGAHVGEVTTTGDGDVFGQTVNIAARLQGLAQPGQAVVSEAFARAAGGTGNRSLGKRALKNVPEPLECQEMALA